MYGRTEGDSRVRFIGEGSMQSQDILVTAVGVPILTLWICKKYMGIFCRNIL